MWIRNLYEKKDIALRLPPCFDAARLAADLGRMDESWWENHLSDYHDGNWQTIALFAPGGSRQSQVSFGGAFAPTEALLECAYFREVIDSLPGRKNRVRLLRLRSGGAIFPHSDPLHQIDRDLVRLHIAVQTNPAVTFLVRDVAVVMRPGETWFVDVRFRHSVTNSGSSHRVHLVVDVAANDELRALMAAAESIGKGRLTSYFLKHALGKRIVRLLGIGN